MIQRRTLEGGGMMEPTLEEIFGLARKLVEEGILPDGSVEDLESGGADTVLGNLYTLLLESGIEDPEEFLRRRGILE